MCFDLMTTKEHQTYQLQPTLQISSIYCNLLCFYKNQRVNEKQSLDMEKAFETPPKPDLRDLYSYGQYFC